MNDFLNVVGVAGLIVLALAIALAGVGKNDDDDFPGGAPA